MADQVQGDESADRLTYCTPHAVHILDARTKQSISIIPPVSSGAALSVDGQQIAFTFLVRPHAELKMFDLATGRPRIDVRYASPGLGTRWGLLDAAFSPDPRADLQLVR